MEIDFAASGAAGPVDVERAAVAAEATGYAGFAVPETQHDVFVALAMAARATTRITVRSAVAVAFARNPMSVAVAANDIQLISRGRLQLGLGSQVQQHIERRFAMPWSRPAARMEEFISALRAIWSCWATGEKLTFRGSFYQHTLMNRFFDPGPNPYGPPCVLLAAVGERMTAVAARVADGVLCHAFTSAAYVRECTLPVVREVRDTLDGFLVCLPAMVVLGEDDAQRASAERAVREQIAFYGSTPAYRRVLELHGWGELHERLNTLARRQAWQEMGAAVSDDVLDAFAVAGDAALVARALRERFDGIVDRISLYTPYPVDPHQVEAVVAAFRSGQEPDSAESAEVVIPGKRA